MDSQPGRPEHESGDPSTRDARLRRMLAELERLRAADIFTEEQFEDERRRLRREAAAGAEDEGRDPPAAPR